ncbi:MAG: sensor protein Chase2, partial [Kovacikia sp.]
MSKRVVLKLNGTLEQGFQGMLEIGMEGELHFTEQLGALPPSPELAERLFYWQQDYRKLSKWTRITLKHVSTQIGALNYGEQIERCRQSAKALVQDFRHWLKAETFLAIDKHLRTSLNPNEPVRLLLRTPDQRLHRLPWHLWDFVEDYPQAEVAFGTHLSQRTLNKRAASGKIRILAILGDRSGINIEHDRLLLENLPDVTIEFLVEPSLPQISQQLWERDWDILFFAGHSRTEEQQGCIYINAQESLSIEDLKLGLKRAINNGLKLAIFNSCDG